MKLVQPMYFMFPLHQEKDFGALTVQLGIIIVHSLSTV